MNTLSLFNSNHVEIGSLDKNLILNTQGKIKIRYGRKFIDLLDNKGNLNIKIPSVIIKVDSIDKIKLNGFYLVEDIVYVYYDGELILISKSEEDGYLKYDTTLNLDSNQINIVLSNIGLKFSSLKEASEKVSNGIVFIDKDIYYINKKEFIKLTLNEPLFTINNTEFSELVPYNAAIVYDNEWKYIPIVKLKDFNEYKEDIQKLIDEIKESLSLEENYDSILYLNKFTLSNIDIDESGITCESTPELKDGNIYMLNCIKVEEVLIDNPEDYIEDDKINEELLRKDYDYLFYTYIDGILKIGRDSGNSTTISLKYDKNSLKFLNSAYEEVSGTFEGDSLVIEIDSENKVVIDENNVKYIYLLFDEHPQKIKINYDNSEINFENNVIPNSTSHTIIGNIKDKRSTTSTIDFGLYSEYPVFIGGEFNNDYPKYSLDLNDSLNEQYYNVNNKSIIVPTIDWVLSQVPIINDFEILDNPILYLESFTLLNIKIGKTLSFKTHANLENNTYYSINLITSVVLKIYSHGTVLFETITGYPEYTESQADIELIDNYIKELQEDGEYLYPEANYTVEKNIRNKKWEVHYNKPEYIWGLSLQKNTEFILWYNNNELIFVDENLNPYDTIFNQGENFLFIASEDVGFSIQKKELFNKKIYLKYNSKKLKIKINKSDSQITLEENNIYDKTSNVNTILGNISKYRTYDTEEYPSNYGIYTTLPVFVGSEFILPLSFAPQKDPFEYYPRYSNVLNNKLQHFHKFPVLGEASNIIPTIGWISDNIRLISDNIIIQGMIIGWGNAVSIDGQEGVPEGWVLCDGGEQGVPDLTDYFMKEDDNYIFSYIMRKD